MAELSKPRTFNSRAGEPAVRPSGDLLDGDNRSPVRADAKSPKPEKKQ